MKLNQYRNKINSTLRKDYDHEQPYIPMGKDFCRAIKNMLKSIFPDAEITDSKGTYCYASGFLTFKNGKTVYYNFNDFRYRRWDEQILVRTARDTKDYSGGCNHYAYGLEDIEYQVRTLAR